MSGAMMAALITVTGATLEPGAPVVLFPTRIDGGGVDAQNGRQYDVAPDGRFLINTVLDNAAAPITLVLLERIAEWAPCRTPRYGAPCSDSNTPAFVPARGFQRAWPSGSTASRRTTWSVAGRAIGYPDTPSRSSRASQSVTATT